jgi:hypothetical protein
VVFAPDVLLLLPIICVAGTFTSLRDIKSETMFVSLFEATGIEGRLTFCFGLLKAWQVELIT